MRDLRFDLIGAVCALSLAVAIAGSYLIWLVTR
jgi:hypothetical protein